MQSSSPASTEAPPSPAIARRAASLSSSGRQTPTAAWSAEVSPGNSRRSDSPTAAQQAAREAGELNLHILGSSMAELLARQCEEEIDHTRMVEAHALGAKAADSISEKHLSLITRFKAPPPALLTLLDATFLLLKLPLAPPEDAALSPAAAP